MYRTHSTVFVTQNNQFICKLLKVRAHITVLARNFYLTMLGSIDQISVMVKLYSSTMLYTYLLIKTDAGQIRGRNFFFHEPDCYSTPEI